MARGLPDMRDVRPDYVVTDSVAPWGHWVAQVLGHEGRCQLLGETRFRQRAHSIGETLVASGRTERAARLVRAFTGRA